MDDVFEDAFMFVFLTVDDEGTPVEVTGDRVVLLVSSASLLAGRTLRGCFCLVS